MPVDTTRTIPTRRTQRKMTEEEMKEIEMKRIRGAPIVASVLRSTVTNNIFTPSFAESAMWILLQTRMREYLPLRAPSGILSAGQGTRFILADTEQLHGKIAEMSHRIRQLEDALAIFQSTISDERHPLLTEQQLKIKFGSEALPRSRKTAAEEEEEKTLQTIDAIGTLTLNESGAGAYFGRSAGSETLMAGEESSSSSEEEDNTRVPLPTELEGLSNLFPFTRKHQSKCRSLELLERHLPSHERAWGLAQNYLEHGAFFFRPIKRDELQNSVLPNVYNVASQRVRTRINFNAANESSPPGENGIENGINVEPDHGNCHALAMCFFVFALGSLFDVNLPPYNAEAEKYYDLGRAALSAKAVYDSPSIETVQSIGLMATYHTLAGKKYSRDSAWCLMSLAAKLAQSIGLHRDSARWNLGSSIVENRRNVFWEVTAADVSHSLALGRPPSIHFSFVDCEFPLDEEATLSNDGQIEYGFWRMKHVFARDVFMPIIETTLTAKPNSYAAVLNLDRKVRETVIPTSLTNPPDVNRSSSSSLKAAYATQHRTVPLLYLHRSFFAQAMLDHPTNPLLSPFSPSFLTAYRSASLAIKYTKEHFEHCAEIGMRIWFLLYHTFSAAIIVGTVVTRSPGSTFAPRAFYELQISIELFEQTAKQSSRARTALNVLIKLKEKATRASCQYNGVPSPLGAFPFSRPGDELDDELAIFGGQKRVIARKSRSHKSSTSVSSGDSPPRDAGSASPPLHSPSNPKSQAAYQEVHPMLLQYLQGATFRSPPRQAATIPAVAGGNAMQVGDNGNNGMAPPQLPITKNAEMAGPDGYSALYNGTPSDRKAGVGPSMTPYTSSISSTPSNTSLMTPAGSRSNSFSSHRTMVDGNDSAIWQGKVEPISLPLSDTHYLDWLSSSASSPFQSPDQMHGTEPAFPDSVQTSPDVTSFGMSTTTSLNAHQARLAATAGRHSVQLPTTANTFDIFGVPPGTAFLNGYGFNSIPPGSPTGTMVELGVSSEAGMDARWMTFVHDCGIIENGSGLQQNG
ncbi:hypothetical protein APHAL10511_000723 [Amanita phalloides]|nr:hypothetical protein APHAL10511_000723 [Amanita phalloides]